MGRKLNSHPVRLRVLLSFVITAVYTIKHDPYIKRDGEYTAHVDIRPCGYSGQDAGKSTPDWEYDVNGSRSVTETCTEPEPYLSILRTHTSHTSHTSSVHTAVLYEKISSWRET